MRVEHPHGLPPVAQSDEERSTPPPPIGSTATVDSRLTCRTGMVGGCVSLPAPCLLVLLPSCTCPPAGAGAALLLSRRFLLVGSRAARDAWAVDSAVATVSRVACLNGRAGGVNDDDDDDDNDNRDGSTRRTMRLRADDGASAARLETLRTGIFGGCVIVITIVVVVDVVPRL